MHRYTIFSLFFLTCFSLALLQPVPAHGAMPLPSSPDSIAAWRPLDTLWLDFRSIFTDALLLLERPLHFDGTDWGLAGGVTAGTGLLMLVDEELHHEMMKLQGRDGDRITTFGNTLGRNEIGLYTSAILYVSGSVVNIPKIRLMGRHLFQALLYGSALNSLLKHGFGRHRPYLGDGPYTFKGPWQKDNSFLSFASGHTLVAFTVASTLSAELDNPWVTAGLYSLATLAGLSRMYSNNHWASDVFLAGGLASAIGYGVVHLHDGSERSDVQEPTSSFHFTPRLNGFALTWKF